MSSDQPYNELGQILSSQGEVAVGLAILKQGTGGSFIAFFNRRFGFLADNERDSLLQLSEAMVENGATMQQLPAGASISLENVPLNPYLFGGATQGSRVLITGEVEIPGAEHRVQLRIPFTDVPTVDEVRQAFLERGLEIAGNYPGKFGLDPNTPVMGGNVYILLPERAF